jgi:predicted permease
VERGLPALAVFIWFIIAFIWYGLKAYKKEKDGFSRGIILGGVTGFIGFIVAGLTEYDFGPSLLIQIVWFVVAIVMYEYNKNNLKLKI